MNPFISLGFFGQSVLAAGLALGVAGCTGGMLTYGTDAREQGVVQLNENQPEKAAGSFQNAVRQNPRDYKSFYYLGVSYDKSGNYAQSIQAYRASLDVQQLTIDGRHDHKFRRQTLDGLAIAISKSPGRATEIQAIEQKHAGRETAEDALLLAKIFTYSGDADSAIDCYNRSVLLDPEDPAISREAGLYFEQIRKPQMAEPLLKWAYVANPSDEPVVAALRRLGIVPGPSLKDERALIKPPMPLGPIPEIKNKDEQPPAAHVQSPRD